MADVPVTPSGDDRCSSIATTSNSYETGASSKIGPHVHDDADGHLAGQQINDSELERARVPSSPAPKLLHRHPTRRSEARRARRGLRRAPLRARAYKNGVSADSFCIRLSDWPATGSVGPCTWRCWYKLQQPKQRTFFSNHIHAAAMEYRYVYNGAASAYYYDAASSSAAAFPPAEFGTDPSGGLAPLDVVFDYVPNEGVHPAPASVPAGTFGTPPPPLRSMPAVQVVVPGAAGYRGHAAR
jgi:hypothetical protein